jgi:hypothetical protein
MRRQRWREGTSIAKARAVTVLPPKLSRYPAVTSLFSEYRRGTTENGSTTPDALPDKVEPVRFADILEAALVLR